MVGKRESDATRLDELKIAGYTIAKPPASLLKNEVSAEKDLAGNIGMDVFRQFDITFDFVGKVAYFEPNSNFGKKIAYERAGMIYEKRGNAYEVINVLPGSPAAGADVERGDVVLALDGTPVERLDGPARREVLRQSPGTRVKVTLRRGSAVRTVNLTLRDIL